MSDTQAPSGPEEETMQPPVITGSPTEIAAGVFVIPDHGVELVPNVGVIVGDRAALVVDSGLGPRNGPIVRSIAQELAGPSELHYQLTPAPAAGMPATSASIPTCPENDPLVWVRLALALRDDGRFADSLAAYRRCELLYFVGPHGHSDGR